VKTASPGQIVVMLYGEAVRQLDIAGEILGRDVKKSPALIEPFNKAVVKAQDIITELTASLDFETTGEIASNLFALYVFFNKTLMEANLKKDGKSIKSVRDMLDDLKGAWVEVVGSPQANQGQGKREGVNIAG
jgi:flagellar protein FliS